MENNFSCKWRRVLTETVLIALLINLIPLPLLPAKTAKADETTIPDADLYVTNGHVADTALSEDGSTLYLGGSFFKIGPRSGGGAVFDLSNGTSTRPYPKVAGYVKTTITDGSSGWFIGGHFAGLDGVARDNIAHIRADGTLDQTWDFGTDDEVDTLYLFGTTLYVGGKFTNIGGQARNHIAAIDTNSGTISSFNPNANGNVYAFAASGTTLYVGGKFTNIGGQARSSIAAVDTSTGLATTWNPNATGLSAEVHVFLLSGSILYTGGSFLNIGGQNRANIAAFDIGTGAVTAWDPSANGSVHAFSLSGTTIYAGGYFNIIGGGQSRPYLAAIDTSTGLATAWNPLLSAGQAVLALAISGSTVYAGGGFTTVNGQDRPYAAGIDMGTGTTTSWNPSLDAKVNALALDGTNLYVGGNFGTVENTVRNNIAAIDVATGRLTSWDPNADNNVSTIKESGGTVYVGGGFANIGGQARSNIAAVDVSTGLATAWDPNANNDVYVMDVSGSTVYVGGYFTNIGGQARNYIAALDTGTGLATTWDPDADADVDDLVVSGSTVYVGGYFTNIGGQARNYIAALDTGTGLATTWDPDADGAVYTLDYEGPIIYAGGEFTNIGGQARDYVAALDTNTGLATAWDPNTTANPSEYVSDIAVSGSYVYIGGYFTAMGGQVRHAIAAVDVQTGVAKDWDPNPDTIGGADSVGSDEVYTLAFSDSMLYVGGSYRTMGTYATVNLSGFSLSSIGQDVTITADVPAALSFVIRNSGDTSDTNVCDLGVLSSSATSTCSYRLRIQTNAASGFAASVQADHDFSGGNATMTVVTDNAALGAGAEAYGFESVQGASYGGRHPATAEYTEPVVVTDDVGTTFNASVSPIPTSTSAQIISYDNSFSVTSTPSLTGTTLITHFATISNGTPASDYSQTLTYTVTGSY